LGETLTRADAGARRQLAGRHACMSMQVAVSSIQNTDALLRNPKEVTDCLTSHRLILDQDQAHIERPETELGQLFKFPPLCAWQAHAVDATHTATVRAMVDMHVQVPTGMGYIPRLPLRPPSSLFVESFGAVMICLAWVSFSRLAHTLMMSTV
jgi:hypothetical protein